MSQIKRNLPKINQHQQQNISCKIEHRIFNAINISIDILITYTIKLKVWMIVLHKIIYKFNVYEYAYEYLSLGHVFVMFVFLFILCIYFYEYV